METRRQKATLDNALVPLGNGHARKAPGNSGFGEDLGSTSYKPKSVRPSIARNPRAVKKAEEDKQQRKKARAPSNSSSGDEVTALDESADPIDFLPQTSQPTSSQPKNRPRPRPIPSDTNSKRVAQPPPFGKSQSAKSLQPKPVPIPPLKPKPSTVGRIENSDSESASSFDAIRGGTKKKDFSPPQPPSSQPSSPEDRDPPAKKNPVRAPEPPPFGRSGPSVRVTEPAAPLAPRVAAPPPFKSTSTAKVIPTKDVSGKRVNSVELNDASQPDSGSQPIDSDMLKKIRIPRRNDKNPSAVAPVPAKDPPADPKKKLAAFPMAAYAKEVAAKQAVENTTPGSPRKRFKPDDVERLLQRAEEEELMGVDDETLPHVDPRELCPFCDERLPDNPSPDLLQLLAELRATATPEPRLRNPLGLTAPLMTFINLCQMHRAESTHIEQGRQNRWPSVVDWEHVRERLRGSRVADALQDIIHCPESSEFFVTLQNIIKRDGVLKAASIRGQLDTFQLSYPGYYGEQGLLVFFDALNELFPNLTSEESKPLSPRQFFLSVLVPEAATLLIEQDMDCTHEEALITLRESREYGLAMFPDRGGFFGSGKDDHMDDAGAKQLQWRKDMVESSNSSSAPDKDKFKAPLVTTRFLETDPDVLVVD